MLQIVCIKAGPKFGPDYVNILFDMVRRNLAEGHEGVFTCFTDNPAGLDGGIAVRPLPANLPGWWSKLALFRRGLFSPGDRILFLDLDTVITGRIDELCSYDGPFAILRDVYRPQGLQSSVMAWSADECPEIWDSYHAAGCPMDDTGGDQAWIERSQSSAAKRLQDVFPRMFVSFKKLRGIPATESVVFFHGNPRPHEVTDGWVPMVWKVGGLSRSDMMTVCNTAEAERIANVRSSCARSIPWLSPMEAHDGHAVIVGGGPSLSETLKEIIWRKSLGQQVWALNGAAAYLRRFGIVPDAHVIVDARPANVAFTNGADSHTVHFVASQVSPSVFDALAERKTVLWHANSPGMEALVKEITDQPCELIGGGSTVGLNAMVVAHVLGFRKIHLYGFDSSYRDAEGHAYAQTANSGDRMVDAVFAGKKFRSSPWMIQQAEEFVGTATALADMDAIITVHGDGLLPTVALDMALNPPMTPAAVRAAEVLNRLLGVKNPIGAEIGTFAGDMACKLLLRDDLTLYMVDSWEGSGQSYKGDSGDWHASLTQDQQDEYMDRARQMTLFAEDRAKFIRKRSVDAAKQIPDESLDFVFIDADHSYEGCMADILAWKRKVKPGGWLCGHDYENSDFPKFGVTRAVNEWTKALELHLTVGENFTWFVRIPERQLQQEAA